MKLYHYRSVESALLEIGGGTFHFAAREELNDPVEGYVRVFWQGDKAAWEGLFRNYICSLYGAIELFLLRSDEKKLHHNTLLIDFHRFDNVPLGGILKTLGNEFLEDEDIQKLSTFYGENRLKVRDGELQLILQLIHNRALIYCIRNFSAHRLIPEDRAYSFLEMLSARQTSIPEELLKKESVNEKERSVLCRYSRNMIEDMAELKYVELGLGDDKFLYGIPLKKEEQTDGSELVSEARQRRNWLSIAVDFPKVYIDQLKDMLYPESYVVCFSGRCDDSAMWGNYADHHRGVCLIYETDKNNSMNISRKNSYQHLEVKPVCYGGELIERNFFETFGRLNFKQIIPWLTGSDGISSAYDVFSDEEEWRKRYWEVYEAKTYRKIKAWQHENEYRLALTNNLGEFYNPESRNLGYAPEHLKGLIFGINTSEYDKKRIMEKLLARAGELKDFQFYQAEYDDEKQSISMHKKIFWKLSGSRE